MVYRFVGTGSELGAVRFERFGQRAELQPDVAAMAQRGGCALLSESDFNAVGFTTEDLKIWADPFIDAYEVPNDPQQAKAKADFLRKKAEAQQKYIALRQGLLQPQSTTVTATEPTGETPQAPESKSKHKD